MCRFWDITIHGQIDLDRPLSPAHKLYLDTFSKTRHMLRDATVAAAFPDPVREAVGLPIGVDGAYFVGGATMKPPLRMFDESVLNFNKTPADQCSFMCNWAPNADGTALCYRGVNVCDIALWLRYLIRHFLAPWGYVLSGRVTWQGELSDDKGTITVTDNHVRVEC
jgi:hypothetical protein